MAVARDDAWRFQAVPVQALGRQALLLSQSVPVPGTRRVQLLVRMHAFLQSHGVVAGGPSRIVCGCLNEEEAECILRVLR